MASKLRDRIVGAATKTFAKKGFCGTSTRDVARLADVTEGSLFRLYQSKENLALASIELVIKRFAAGLKLRPAELRLLTYAILEYPEQLSALLVKQNSPVKRFRIVLPGFDGEEEPAERRTRKGDRRRGRDRRTSKR